MSTFQGPQGKGAMRRHKELKRAEAEERQAAVARDAALLALVAREQNVLRRLAHRRAVRAQGAPEPRA